MVCHCCCCCRVKIVWLIARRVRSFKVHWCQVSAGFRFALWQLLVAKIGLVLLSKPYFGESIWQCTFWDSILLSNFQYMWVTREDSKCRHDMLDFSRTTWEFRNDGFCPSAPSSSSSSRDAVKHEHVGLEQKHVITAARREDFLIKVPNYWTNVRRESCCELHFFAVQSSYCSRLYRGELGGVIHSVMHQLDGASATILGTYIIAHYVILQEWHNITIAVISYENDC